jgi:hypothetical protein
MTIDLWNFHIHFDLIAVSIFVGSMVGLYHKWR